MIEMNFKETKIGKIPAEWEVRRIGEFANITTGNMNTQDNVVSGKYPFYVRSQNVERADQYSFNTEGVVTAGDGVGTGKIFHYVNGKFGLHQRAYLIYNFKNVEAKYFYWVFSKNFYERVMSMTAKSSVDSVRMEMISDMLVAVPPLTEQRRIADALSKVDGLIESVDKLIAKKQAIKNGAMQELLTGKKRLKGFEGEWLRVKIGDYFDIYDGTHQTPHYVLYGIPFYSVENVTAGNFKNVKYISVEEHDKISKGKEIQKGDVLMTRIGSIGNCKFIDSGVNASFYVSLALLKPHTNVDSQFFCYASNTKEFKKSIMMHSLILAIPQKINLGEISNVEYLSPSDLSEQRAIDHVLSTMNSEIEALERKRDKYKQVKQGMMQDLLTGRIRLTEN